MQTYTSKIGSTVQSYIKQIKQKFSGNILSDYANRVAYATDNSIFQILPELILLPKNKADIQLALSTINQPKYRALSITAKGGGTSTNGQSLNNSIILDVSKYMNRILELDIQSKTVVVEAGVVLNQLNDYLAKHNLKFGPTVSPAQNATIGGMINTDASGQGSLYYGKTSDNVFELESVMIDGSILKTSSIQTQKLSYTIQNTSKTEQINQKLYELVKDRQEEINQIFPNQVRGLTGYNLKKLFNPQKNTVNTNYVLSGSEGTLSIVTQATLRLHSQPQNRVLFVLLYENFFEALKEAQNIKHLEPNSIETIDGQIFSLAQKSHFWQQIQSVFENIDLKENTSLNLIEFFNDDDKLVANKKQQLLTLLNQREKTKSVYAFLELTQKSEIQLMYELRKKGVGFLASFKGKRKPIPFVEDTAVPPEKLSEYIQEFKLVLDNYHLNYGMFGHVDAGCLHVRPALDMSDEQDRQIMIQISHQIKQLVKKYSGVFWGEHSKGIRSEYAPEVFGSLYPIIQSIKKIFDPYNQLNPGKITSVEKTKPLYQIATTPLKGQYDEQVTSNVKGGFEKSFECNGNTACFNYDLSDMMCPSYKATRQRLHSPKGRAMLIRQWLHSSFLKKSHLCFLPKWIKKKIIVSQEENEFNQSVYDAMDGCLSCKACTYQCPVNINIPIQKTNFLNIYHQFNSRPLKDYVLYYLESILPYLSYFANFFNRLNHTSGLKKIIQWLGYYDFPNLSKLNLNRKLKNQKLLFSKSCKVNKKTVFIFQDPFNSYLDNELVLDLIILLKKLGYSAKVLKYYPSGKSLLVKGFKKQFNKVAKKQINYLNKIAKYQRPILCLEGAIVSMIQEQYSELGLDKNIKIQLVQEFLAENINLPKKEQNQSTENYYLLTHCTEIAHKSNVAKLWQKVFEQFNLKLNILASGCCGMAGIYGHELKNYENSQFLYQASWQKNTQRYMDKLLVTGFSCRSQIKRFSNIHVKHPVQQLTKIL